MPFEGMTTAPFVRFRKQGRCPERSIRESAPVVIRLPHGRPTGQLRSWLLRAPAKRERNATSFLKAAANTSFLFELSIGCIHSTIEPFESQPSNKPTWARGGDFETQF